LASSRPRNADDQVCERLTPLAEAFEFYAPRCDRVVTAVFERLDMLNVGVRGD